jgi:hypothetical protein
MATKSKRRHVTATPNPSRGQALTLAPLPSLTKRSIRGIAKDLVGSHTTEIGLRIREGMLSQNLRLALKFLTFVSDRTDGRPVETHRMVGLNDGPTGTYDLSKLGPKDQKALLKLLRAAKDESDPSGKKE